MAILAGIDEAGYGPVLGPLVVSCVAFELPEALANRDLWELLRESVSREAKRGDTRLPIADSKKLHRSRAGLSMIERSALAMLAAAERHPRNTLELLQELCPGLDHALAGYPWYQDINQAVPLECDRTVVQLKAHAVARTLRANDIRFRIPRCCVLPEGHFNRMISQTRNKATVLWTLTSRLISHLLNQSGDGVVHIVVDRQGGRIRYTSALLTAFQDAHLEVLHEDTERSRYRLRFPGSATAEAIIEFRQSAESAHLAVALASVFSKYLRELLMTAFNGYWQLRVDGLRRTAGYYQDGLRFLKDIEPAVRTLAIDRHMLVRCK